MSLAAAQAEEVEAGKLESSTAFAGQGDIQESLRARAQGRLPPPLPAPVLQPSAQGRRGPPRVSSLLRKSPWPCRGRPVAHRVSGKPQRGGLLAARRAHAEMPE